MEPELPNRKEIKRDLCFEFYLCGGETFSMLRGGRSLSLSRAPVSEERKKVSELF